MDNLAAHKVAGIREAIEAKGAELAYLPAYSPDLGRIFEGAARRERAAGEQLFAELKALLRRAGARGVDDVRCAIGRGLDAFTPTEGANDLANSGYVPR